MDIEALKTALPEIATNLVKMMTSALEIYQGDGPLSLTDASPEVAIVYHQANGEDIKVTLVIDVQER